MSKTRDNHYVPQWYQKGFLISKSNQLHYLDLTPDKEQLPDGRIITMNCVSLKPTSKCFYETDLYTTFFGKFINDEIEKYFFGKIDSEGAKAVRAFIGHDMGEWHRHFTNFFSYMDCQKIRTPKGLDWIKLHYPDLDQLRLMLEMQSIRNLNCTIWTEGVREIVSAKKSTVKFIISDHPVTTYNYAYIPISNQCIYPNDPPITQKGTQTIYPLDRDHCLILTNLEYAEDPDNQDPKEKRTNARFFRDSLVRTDAFIRNRELNDEEVSKINLIIKSRARRYIAAENEEWLYPEKIISIEWPNLKKILLPPKDKLFQFGGEIYVGNKDGSTYYQDAFGRTIPENKYLRKSTSNEKIGRNNPCPCGSGNKFKKCCIDKKEKDRSTWNVLSIRERNLVLYNGLYEIFGFNNGKSWDDVRREISDEQVAKFHSLYGSLWPIEEDIFSLLPKPDDKLRVIYTGMIDPRTITLFALGAVPYFDEILIQHPFINPGYVKPKFSPVESPHQYKSQTLTNLLLLLYLEPFIASGAVNFIPDPCCFDQYIHHQMLDMATQRKDQVNFNEREFQRHLKLQKEDFFRKMALMPEEYILHQISQAIPELSSEEIEKVYSFMQRQNQEDPLALLQENVMAEGGQRTMVSLAPNFEMSLFIAQATGAIILTDSETRWEEFKLAQFKRNGTVSHPWSTLSDYIKDFKFTFSAEPKKNFNYRINGWFGGVRKVIREIYSNVQKCQSTPDKGLLERLKVDFKSKLESALKSYDKNDQNTFQVKMEFLMPKGGFVDNNVQRLLLKSGSEKHLHCSPMAIFIEPCNRSQRER